MLLQADNLPTEIRTIAGLIGPEATLRLVERFGGQTIAFVRGARLDTRERRAELDALVGVAQMELLIAHFGNTDVYIARCADAVRAVRDQEIVAAYDSGKTVAELVRKHNLSDRRIKQILKDTDNSRPASTAQAGLF